MDEGLLILHRDARHANVTGNRLGHNLGSLPGHGILIRDDVFDVTIDDNEILFASRFGIGTFTETTVLSQSRISRNRIRGCSGQVPPPGAGQRQRTGGAVVINESDDVRFIDNVLTNNAPILPAGEPPPWFVVFFENARGLEISGNQLTDNINTSNVPSNLGAFLLDRIRGAVRFQNNVMRDNGGRSLFISGAVKPEVHRVLIQNNQFFGGQHSTSVYVFIDSVDSISFQGNQCEVLDPQLNRGLMVFLRATRANVGNNVVDLPLSFSPQALRIEAAEALVNANSVRLGTNALAVIGIPAPAPLIVTSNLTTGILAPGAIRANNIPAP